MPINDLITLRKGTFAQWFNANPVLNSGEPGFDIANNIVKVGDGINNWNTLGINAAGDVYVYVKNTTGGTLNKGQVVYINSAQGDHPTISLAVASGETTSSKTLGLLRQNLLDNEFGYVVSEGVLDGVNTEAALAGDTIWLSPTTPGGVVYGNTNKPYAPNHMVFLGYVLRAQTNNGKIYIKIQNGYELEELHNVATIGATNGQFLQYNSNSGLWLASSSGNFISLSINGTGVSINGHTHTSSQITDFNSATSGLLPVKNVVAGTGIAVSASDGVFTINSTSNGTGPGGGLSNVVEDTTPQLGGDLDLNNYSISGVSFQTTSSGTIIGSDGWIYQSGQSVRSEGYFQSPGDSQHSQYILRCSTTDDNWTSFKNNNTNAILLASNRTISFSVNIVARATNIKANAAYKLEGLLFNDGYGAEIIGLPIKTILGEDVSSLDVRASISGGGSGLSDYLLLEASGSNSYNINWLAKVDLLEVGGTGFTGYELNSLSLKSSFIP